MTSEAAIRKRLGEHNNELSMHAVVALSMGLATLAGIYIVILLVCFASMATSSSLRGSFAGIGMWFWVATGVFGLFLLASVWACWRRQDPMAELTPIDDADMPMIVGTYALTDMLTSPRHAIAGFATLFIHGPKCCFDAVGKWRARLPGDERSVREGAAFLDELRTLAGRPKGSGNAATAGRAAAPATMDLLRRLGLVKQEKSAATAPVRWLLTMKAMDLLGGASRG